MTSIMRDNIGGGDVLTSFKVLSKWDCVTCIASLSVSPLLTREQSRVGGKRSLYVRDCPLYTVYVLITTMSSCYLGVPWLFLSHRFEMAQKRYLVLKIGEKKPLHFKTPWSDKCLQIQCFFQVIWKNGFPFTLCVYQFPQNTRFKLEFIWFSLGM